MIGDNVRPENRKIFARFSRFLVCEITPQDIFFFFIFLPSRFLANNSARYFSRKFKFSFGEHVVGTRKSWELQMIDERTIDVFKKISCR